MCHVIRKTGKTNTLQSRRQLDIKSNAKTVISLVLEHMSSLGRHDMNHTNAPLPTPPRSCIAQPALEAEEAGHQSRPRKYTVRSILIKMAVNPQTPFIHSSYRLQFIQRQRALSLWREIVRALHSMCVLVLAPFWGSLQPLPLLMIRLSQRSRLRLRAMNCVRTLGRNLRDAVR